MNRNRSERNVTFTPEQRAEQRRIRAMFKEWHPSPEELIASGAGREFKLFGEYPYLRSFLGELKVVREEAGLSLSEVASRCGIDKAALSRLENGRNPNPTLDTLWRYAAAVGKRLVLSAEPIAKHSVSVSGGNTAARPKRKDARRK
jgi:DNA-binding XRE family transcriptional regulator